MLPKQTSYTHTHGHTDLLHTHTVTQTSYTHTQSHTGFLHTHTYTQSHRPPTHTHRVTQASYTHTHTHSHTDLLHTHSHTDLLHTHTHTHTHSHTAIINLKFCSQSIIAGQMPSFIQVTFPPLGLKDSLHKVPELLTYLVVLKAKKLLHL